MSQSFQPIVAPSRAEDISPKWIAQVREIIQRDGHAARPGPQFLTIELQHPNRPEAWQPLNLETNTTVFATAADRDAVLAQIWRAPAK